MPVASLSATRARCSSAMPTSRSIASWVLVRVVMRRLAWASTDPAARVMPV